MVNSNYTLPSWFKRGQTQCWFSLGGKQEDGLTVQRHATTATQGRGLGKLSALTNHMTSRLKIRNLTVQGLNPWHKRHAHCRPVLLSGSPWNQGRLVWRKARNNSVLITYLLITFYQIVRPWTQGIFELNSNVCLSFVTFGKRNRGTSAVKSRKSL